jgi:5-methylcytosine-specific restriction endonuclease McrA
MTTVLGYENGAVVAKGTGVRLHHALEALLRDNWARVCRIVAQRQRWRCQSCGNVRRLEFHHCVPRSKGRDDRPENVVGLCTAFGCGAHRRLHGG